MTTNRSVFICRVPLSSLLYESSSLHIFSPSVVTLNVAESSSTANSSYNSSFNESTCDLLAEFSCSYEAILNSLAYTLRVVSSASYLMILASLLI